MSQQAQRYQTSRKRKSEPIDGTPIPSSGKYIIQVSQRTDGADIAECEGLRVVSRNGAEMAMARMLIEAGYPDGPWEVPQRIRGASIARLAELTISETDRGMSIKRWQPFSAAHVSSPAASDLGGGKTTRTPGEWPVAASARGNSETGEEDEG